jgi:hypothetical protein
MPVKSFTFAFKLDAQELLTFIAERNVAVDLHVTGTKRLPEPDAQSAQDVLALPAPSQKPEHSSRELVLKFMARHPKERFSVAVLRAMLVQSHFSPNTVSNVVYILYGAGMIRKSGKGNWKITAKGLREVE